MTTISKTNRLKFLILSLGLSVTARAEVVNPFDCLRGLIPLTDPGARVVTRGYFEPPFILKEKYIVFAEVQAAKVSGFYVYQDARAWYYDEVDLGKRPRLALAQLRADGRTGVFELTAQPNGLETIAIKHLPGFDPLLSARQAGAILGASVLPVIGAFIPHPKARGFIYHDPTVPPENVVKAWLKSRFSSWVDGAPVPNTIGHLSTDHVKTAAALWGPFHQELDIRQDWVRTHNIDVATFRRLNTLLTTSCRSKSN